MPQLKIKIDQLQLDAVARAAAGRGVSKATFVRDAIADATGVRNGFRSYPWTPSLQGHRSGWAAIREGAGPDA
jgi:hypothetical protein